MRYSLLIVLAAMPLLAAAESRLPERIYDIKTSINDGLSNSNELLFTKQEIHLNKYRVREARSWLYPHLDVNTNLSRFSTDNVYALSPDLGESILRRGDNEIDNYYATRFNLKQTLYNGGRAVGTLRLAQASLERAESQYQAIENNVVYEITRAFYTLLLHQEKKRIFDNVQRELDTVRPPARDSRSRTIEVLRYENAKARIATRMAEIAREAERAQMDFIEALNIEQDTRISLKGTLEEKIFETDISLSKCLSWAEQFRPELRQRQFQEEIDALAVNLSIAERYPTLLFGASYEFNGYEFPLDSENWNATLSLNFPIFDGWSGWSRVRQKRAQREQGRYRKAQVKDDVHREVRQVFSDYVFWQNEIDPRRKQLSNSTVLLSAIKKEYAQEKVTTAELIESLINVADLEIQYFQALKEEIIAYAAVEKSIGKVLNEP